MRAERACRVCTAPLPLVLIDIDPAVLKAFLYRCNVVLTKRCERLKHRLLRLIIGNLFGCIRDHRRVDVIHVKFVHPEALLAQLSESGVPLVAVLLGGPYDTALVEKADAVIAAYEYTRLSAAAVLTAFETGRCNGLCPVRLQGV